MYTLSDDDTGVMAHPTSDGSSGRTVPATDVTLECRTEQFLSGAGKTPTGRRIVGVAVNTWGGPRRSKAALATVTSSSEFWTALRIEASNTRQVIEDVIAETVALKGDRP